MKLEDFVKEALSKKPDNKELAKSFVEDVLFENMKLNEIETKIIFPTINFWKDNENVSHLDTLMNFSINDMNKYKSLTSEDIDGYFKKIGLNFEKKIYSQINEDYCSYVYSISFEELERFKKENIQTKGLK